MTAFQLDQCLDSKRFARECAAEGFCQTLRLPPALRNAEDAQLLTVLMADPNPLLTFDRTLPDEHTSSIPDQHPGIIVVTNFPAPQTLTIQIAQRVLNRFKTFFPAWHQVSWRNSIVELTTIGIEVRHVANGRLVKDVYFSFDEADWAARLLTTLQRNSQGASVANTPLSVTDLDA